MIKKLLKLIPCVVICSVAISCATPSSEDTAMRANGLILAAEVIEQRGPAHQSPVIKITFSNSLDHSFALLNHFAYTAIGPSLTIRVPDSSEERGYRQYVFDKQESIRNAEQKWIFLAPGQAHTFTSEVSRDIPVGSTRLQVSYMVIATADAMIQECKKEPNAPERFWKGHALSNVIEINKE